MERLTNKAWRNFDPWECCGQDKYCKRGCHDPGGCTKGCIVPRLYKRLGVYEDTGLTPWEIKSMQEKHFSGLEMAKLHSAFMELKKYQEADKDGRIVELMNADAEGRLKIVPRAPKGTVCGSCVHFDRETGTAHGFCKTQTQMRVSAESPSGRTEPRYVMQSRPACKGYEPLEEDDDGSTD